MVVAGRRSLGDVGSQPVRLYRGTAPGGKFGHDGGVPRAARGRDRPGYIERQHARQRHFPPPQPATHPKVLRRVAQLPRHGRGARDNVEEDVPLGS